MFIAFIFWISVIFLPLAKSFRQIAKLLIMPFWKEIIRDKEQWTYNKSFWLLFNIIWFPIWLILSIFYFISWILLFVTIIWIPAWIVHIKLAKIIILPVWIKVVTKKEYVQELVKDELKKQWKNNDNQKELTIEEKANLYDNIKTWNINKMWDTSIDMKEVLKPHKSLKPILWILILSIQFILILIWLFKYIEHTFRYNGMFYKFFDNIIILILIIFSILSFIQLISYLLSKFNTKQIFEKYIKDNEKLKTILSFDFKILFILITWWIIIIWNFIIILISLFLLLNWKIWVAIMWIISFNILISYQYILWITHLNNIWWIKALKKYLLAHKENRVINLILIWIDKVYKQDKK